MGNKISREKPYYRKEELEKFTVMKLRDMCFTHGQSTIGTKSDLVNRLLLYGIKKER